ncbi:MAG TPA: hypothetical protein DF296_10745 [Candidatus Margulisbacteria bacterium]|nr:hypothetical protein [Candidatus Margulisiibacteriota bacterium]
MNFNKLITDYLENLSQTHSRVTVNNHRKRLYPMISFFLKNPDASIILYKQYILKKRIKANTKYAYLQAAKKFFAFLYINEFIAVDVSADLTLPKWIRNRNVQANLQSLSYINTAVMSEFLTTRYNAIYHLFKTECLSVPEITNISILDLDLNACELRILRQRKFVSLKKNTCTILNQYLTSRSKFAPSTDFLFINNTGVKLTYERIYHILKNPNHDR